MVLAMKTPKDLIALGDAIEEYGIEKLGPIGLTYNKARSWERRGLLTFWRQAGERIYVSRADIERLIQPTAEKREDTPEG